MPQPRSRQNRDQEAPNNEAPQEAPNNEAPANGEPRVDQVPANAPQPPKAGEWSPVVHALLVQAQELRNEKKEYLRRVDDNRKSLRMLKGTGFLDEQQRQAIDAFYPPNSRPQNQGQIGSVTVPTPEGAKTEATPEAAPTPA